MNKLTKKRINSFIVAMLYTTGLIMGAQSYSAIAKPMESVEEVTVKNAIHEIDIFEEASEIDEPVIEEVEEVTEAVVEEIEEEPEVFYFNVPLERELQDHIFALCDERGIDPAIIITMIYLESRFTPDAVGDSGNSLGLMQIQPRWHQARMEALGCTDLLDPYQNVAVGIDLLGDLMDSSGSIEWASMAYNGGAAYANRYAERGEISDYVRMVIGNVDKLYKGETL